MLLHQTQNCGLRACSLLIPQVYIAVLFSKFSQLFPDRADYPADIIGGVRAETSVIETIKVSPPGWRGAPSPDFQPTTLNCYRRISTLKELRVSLPWEFILVCELVNTFRKLALTIWDSRFINYIRSTRRKRKWVGAGHGRMKSEVPI